MPFNLRGGRPKNMRQGIYWVQRHLADQRAAAKAEAANARREQKLATAQQAMIDRFERLFNNVRDFFASNSQVTGTAAQKARIEKAQATWEELRNPTQGVSSLAEANRNVTKFATAGRNLIVAFAKAAKMDTEWVAITKQLKVNGKVYDFS